MAAASQPPAQQPAQPASPAGQAPPPSAQPPAQQATPLANKAGEPPCQMKVEPDTKLSFKSDKLTEEAVTIDLKLTNTTAKRQVYKVRCTCNEVFRVRPPLGFVDPNGTQEIKITFQAKEVPETNKHFFAIYHMAVDEKATVARACFTPTSKPDGVKRLPCSFEKADGSAWPVAEKK